MYYRPWRKRLSGAIWACVLAAGSPLQAADLQPFTVRNPAPATVPTLSLREFPKYGWFVGIRCPSIPDFACDAWCYEGSYELVEAKDDGAGKLVLRHRSKQQPQAILVTTVTPEAGAVEFVARVEHDPEQKGDWPVAVNQPNLCWQLRRAPNFASRPDPYPQFVKRCFIFTDKGRTFLHQTDRGRVPPRSPTDPVNNPPWVQMYLGVWKPSQRATPTLWSEYSRDHYVTPVIGAVSRDGAYLAAIANESAPLMAQAWHDCLHNNAQWLPAGGPLTEHTWRVKIYVMKNDPAALLQRVAADFPGVLRHRVQTAGVRQNLPVFYRALAERLAFPLSWLAGTHGDFDSWRAAARQQVMQTLLAPPPSAPFQPVVLAEQDRGSYVARRLALNITGDSRVAALMTVPKGAGPFPAVLLLHDHGARFDIGKEKVIEPWGGPPAKIASARQWVEDEYGGRYLGDELAKRGYVCLATDALNWSDRGGAGYQGQQALASNLLHLGASLAGVIAHEDLRAAEFLAGRPAVDPKRVAAMGLSMGSFRAWQLAALSDHVAASVSVCWMATARGLMAPGNNQTGGQSAYAFLHPGLVNFLDYPDVASIGCPKPMLFYNGTRDTLFPVGSVKEAYAKMHLVWKSQGAEDKLETRLWDVPHVFNGPMQEAAFRWLDQQLHVP